MTVKLGATAVVAILVLSLAAAAAGSRQAPAVRSTLAGRTVLPHRIAWHGVPNVPRAQVREVEFLIDGKLSWIERNPPYVYGGDGNELVTSWLAPGRHRFTVVAISTSRGRATTKTTARVLPTRPPPAALVGNWQRTVTTLEAGNSGRPGKWRLIVDKVGWRVLDPTDHGALIDVVYLSPGRIEARGGVATRNHSAREGNVWCEEHYRPVRYVWTVVGDTLTLALAGPKRCDGQSKVWAADWSSD
jgi:hypothetical protein